MADIAGVNSFGFQPVRSAPEQGVRGQEDDRRVQQQGLQARALDDADLARGIEPTGLPPAGEAEPGTSGNGGQPRPAEDSVALSSQAQDLSGLDQQGLAEPPNLLEQIRETFLNPQIDTSITRGVNETSNQNQVNETTSAAVNGNTDTRSAESNRALGQLVDQFA